MHDTAFDSNSSGYSGYGQYVTWQIDKDFVAEDFDQNTGGVCIRVSVFRSSNPKYSRLIGWKYPDGELKIYLQHDMQVSPETMADLFAKSSQYIQDELKKSEERRQAEDQKRSAAMLVENQKKAAKKKKYLENQAKRAEENRQRANGHGNGKKKG